MADDAALTIRRNFKRADPGFIKALTGYPTGFFADIQGRRGALDASIKAVFKAPPFVGSALTVKTVPDDNLAAYAALGVLLPGDVLVIGTGGWIGSAIIGDLITGFFKNAGIVAVVTDGAVRDIVGLEQLGLPIFARAVSPNSPQKFGPGEIGGEVAVGGMTIRSGDIVVGDADGVVVLPQACFADAVEAIKGIRDKEAKIEASIATGTVQPDWVKDLLKSGRVAYRD